MVFQWPCGTLAVQPLPARRPAAQRRHVGLGPGLVDEDQAVGVDRGPDTSSTAPAGARRRGDPVRQRARFFLKLSLSAWTNSHTER